MTGGECWYDSDCDRDTLTNGDGQCSVCDGPLDQTGFCCRGDGHDSGCSQDLKEQMTLNGFSTSHACIYMVDAVAGDEGSWAAWGDWGSCSVTCGEGTQKRKRICRNGDQEIDGCTGESYTTQMCQQNNCPSTFAQVL